jgi:tRNA(adenine34) deaminase
MQTDIHYMQLALQEAQKAYDKGEIPIGAILVVQDKIIAKAHNQTELLQDTTAHAEILALTSGFQYMGAKYLPQATLYVTLEPCLMCAGALYWSKIAKVVYGASDVKNGYQHICTTNPFHPKTVIEHGLLAEKSIELMQSFFASRRGKG